MMLISTYCKDCIIHYYNRLSACSCGQKIDTFYNIE